MVRCKVFEVNYEPSLRPSEILSTNGCFHIERPGPTITLLSLCMYISGTGDLLSKAYLIMILDDLSRTDAYLLEVPHLFTVDL